MAKRYQLDEEDIRYTAGSPRATLREEYLTETKPERTYELGYEEGKSAAEAAAARAAENMKEESATGAAAYKPTTATGASAYKPTTETAAAAENKAIMSGDYLEKLANGEKFSYDVSKDPTFLSLMARARREGDLAAKDSIARTSALTGGYGNTYAEQVAQRAAQAQIDAVYDRVPELEAAAYERYRDERSDLRDMYTLLYGREQDQAAADFEREKFDETVRQYDMTRADQREQFAAGMNLDWAKFEEMVKEFGLEYALSVAKNEREILESDREFNEGVRQYNDKSAQGWAGIAIDQQNANTSAYRAALSAADDSPTEEELEPDPQTMSDTEITSAAKSLLSEYKSTRGSEWSQNQFWDKVYKKYKENAPYIMEELRRLREGDPKTDANITKRNPKIIAYID